MRWLIWTLGAIWSSLHSAIGLLLLLTVYFPRRVQFSSGAIDVLVRWNLIPKWAWAQTHGIFIFYRDSRGETDQRLRRHERQHVLQGFILGPIYVVLYPLCSLALYFMGADYYHDNPFERWARKSEPTRLPWVLR